MRIKYPISFWLLIGALILTAFVSFSVHPIMVILSAIDLGLIIGLRCAAHHEGRG